MAFEYKPLDPRVDCIRLVVLEPHDNFDAPIICRLIVAIFGEKPKFQALSYSWGTSEAKNKILLNNINFPVRDNLYNALRYLRSTEVERSIWVDAICINQNDISERNAQLKLMPYIYTRAQTVVVWLGLGIPEIQTDNPFEELQPTHPNYGMDTALNRLQEVAEDLCERDYWQRLWIIQEIGKARKIEICYGNEVQSWKSFHVTAQHATDYFESRPKRLLDQILDKYGDGHKLQSLLERHEEALCQEPRDKIYGLVGLASDTYAGFPMDYGKGLFEVYADAMLFKSHDQLDDEGGNKPNYDMMPFSRLVQRSLGERDNMLPSPTFWEDYVPEGNPAKLDLVGHRKPSGLSDRSDSVIAWMPSGFSRSEPSERPERVFQATFRRSLRKIDESTIIEAPGNVVGKIAYIGPTYREMISQVAVFVEWRKSLRKYLPHLLHRSAEEESDYFLETLENMEEADHEKIFWFDRDISWRLGRAERIESLDAADVPESGFKPPATEYTKSNVSPQSQPKMHASNADSQRLFLISARNLNGLYPKMGLAPPEASVGDYICEFSGGEQSALIRRDNGAIRIVGSVVLAEEASKARERKQNEVEIKTKFNVPNYRSLENDARLDLYMDAITLWDLSR
jgi:hypothetical protein